MRREGQQARKRSKPDYQLQSLEPASAAAIVAEARALNVLVHLCFRCASLNWCPDTFWLKVAFITEHILICQRFLLLLC